ncbi:MAG: hypothetical protein AAGG51_15895 [Cyanobacteria bacterium P01_G01_bin.54]
MFYPLHRWQGLKVTQVYLAIAATLGFWLSASLILDGVVMPCLYGNGMIVQSGFAAAGYTLFEVFNHIELVLAASILVILTGLRQTAVGDRAPTQTMLGLAAGLLAIALLYAYWLTPQLSGWGLILEGTLGNRPAMPEPMLLEQVLYWGLETLKFFGGVWLLNQCVNAGLAQTSDQS